MTAILSFHPYKYYPYEKIFARREAECLLDAKNLREHPDRIEFFSGAGTAQAARLVYFAGGRLGGVAVETLQARLERGATSGRNRQATRYSVHGLHEYKGKFNPQIAKAILNMFKVSAESRVLDPFCGSGTTLVECAHLGADAIGIDLNPFAVFVANAKLMALGTAADALIRIVSKLKKSVGRTKGLSRLSGRDDRLAYLATWFDPDNLATIEHVRLRIMENAGPLAPIFLSIASNLLRDYSLQDPNDLRIRRRKSPLPSLPFFESFLRAASDFAEKLRDAQLILGVGARKPSAILKDTTSLTPSRTNLFDAVVTSPPYAMALPYIDTQRLSLVWLELASPSDVRRLEAELIGSRELRGTSCYELNSLLDANDAELPVAQRNLCIEMAAHLTAKDGFRRRAVPGLLYRYFKAMSASFEAVARCTKRGAPYALVVGHNHSVLGGRRFDIDTPVHLASLALRAGWSIEELIPLQTYHRYGYHVDNAVAAETLVFLRRR